MRKNLLFAALVLSALTGCTSDEFVGDQNLREANETGGAINFNPSSKALTRATSNTGTVAQMLDGQMKIFGVKKTNRSPSATYASVFDNYVLWSNTTNVTTSNPDATTATQAENGWEYVGTSSQTYGASSATLGKDQYIKYWDWSTNEYHFVAGSPVANFTYTITGGEIASATVTGIAGHINPNSSTALTTNPVYIAAPVKKLNNGTDYNTDVQFSFTRQQAFVRVGVYETIPGYKITEMKFYPYEESSDEWGSTPGDNIVLASIVTDPNKYFQGATDGTATVTYDWSTPSCTFDYTDATLVIRKNWYGGAYNYVEESPAPAWEMATTSNETNVDKLYGKDSDRGTNGYFTVIPMKSGGTAQPILVKCDYVLTALGSSNETIKVSGATAAIPSAFTYWNPNTSYTYLFKISDNTNGKTGSNQPNDGLYPITFDAVVTAEASGTEQGTITTVSTPSITTYQTGSVTNYGIEYKTGTAIYLTVENNTTGALCTLTDGGSAEGAVQVYKLSAAVDANPAPTEADLQITTPSGTNLFTLGGADVTVDNVTLPKDNHGSFTPTEAGFYAIQYLYQTSPTAYTYKIVKVVAGT